ncbi:MAG TPA: diaminopimelate epimerase [Kineosporiaceae bacterium]|nr:diaminopimelate epimerase [Kineosporiaceae bacterium]
MHSAIRFAKGHGTENDFVVVPDLDGELDLSAPVVAALCDRRSGIGGDGLIRVIRCEALAEGAGQTGRAEWFMDYRNADGSVAEMCGNGVRVFVRYLLESGLIRLAEGEQVAVGTRAGVKLVRRDGDDLAADLGPWRIVGGAAAAEAGADVAVTLRGETVDLPGLSVDLGNPHVVVALPDQSRLAGADLSVAPRVHPANPAGTNVEFVVPVHEAHAHLIMRVHERGVGETRSCGTGTAAAVLAARVWAGERAPDAWQVDVPGGRLRVTTPHGDLLAGPSVELAGPAVLVAEGRVDPAWLAGRLPVPVPAGND